MIQRELQKQKDLSISSSPAVSSSHQLDASPESVASPLLRKKPCFPLQIISLVSLMRFYFKILASSITEHTKHADEESSVADLLWEEEVMAPLVSINTNSTMLNLHK